MKKRLISYLCLLCATVLLFSSCAAGLPGHELFSTIGDKVGDFSSNVKNLLQKNKPIIIDGKSNYTLVYSATESNTVKQAITDLCICRFKGFCSE